MPKKCIFLPIWAFLESFYTSFRRFSASTEFQIRFFSNKKNDFLLSLGKVAVNRTQILVRSKTLLTSLIGHPLTWGRPGGGVNGISLLGNEKANILAIMA